MSTIQRQYDAIALLYDLLAEGDDGMLYFRLQAERLLREIKRGASVLDCACGTGNHAIWLAKQGFSVDASDISESMLDRARHKALDQGLNIRCFRSSWEELPQKSGRTYELVLCPGNSISHLPDLYSIGRSARSFRSVTCEGGHFYFDIRNWEKTFEEDNLHEEEFRVTDGHVNYLVRYSYLINGWNVKSKMFVDIRKERAHKSKRYEFDFFPAGYDQYRSALRDAGFRHVERGFYPGRDYYFVVAG